MFYFGKVVAPDNGDNKYNTGVYELPLRDRGRYIFAIFTNTADIDSLDVHRVDRVANFQPRVMEIYVDADTSREYCQLLSTNL